MIVFMIIAFTSVWQTSQSSDPFHAECVTGRYPPPATTKVPWYEVNLDLPPQDRWLQLVSEKKTHIRTLISTFRKVLSELIGNETNAIFDFINNNMGKMVDSLPYPFNEELRGVAKASGIPLGEIVLYNIFYEVFTVCTSVIAQDSSGEMYHARNLDFGLFMGWDIHNHTWYITEALKPAIVNINFVRHNTTVAKATAFAGYIGIITGMKPGVFSLTVNERFNIDGGYLGLIRWLLGDRTSTWMGVLTRQVLENCTSYDNAYQYISKVPLIAPAYYILGGVHSGEGSVITRSREETVDTWHMEDTSHPWYILETNYDHWKAPLFVDDRRTPANNCMMKKTQQNVSFSGLFDLLSSKPVLNKLTTYTSLMQVKSGKMETYLQNCPDPCWSW